MIGASNEVHFKEAVPDNALGGGFVARTFIIYADKKSVVNPLTSKPKESISVQELSKYLRVLANLRGEFKFSDSAREVYNKWYEEFSENTYMDTTGTIERLHDHILKAAMLISLSRKTNLIMEEDDIREAIIACQDFVPGARWVTLGGGQSASAPGTAVFLRELLSRKEQKHTMSRIKMLQKHWSHFDAFELDRIAESLESQKAITIKIMQNEEGKKEVFYILAPKIIENYSKMQKES